MFTDSRSIVDLRPIPKGLDDAVKILNISAEAKICTSCRKSLKDYRSTISIKLSQSQSSSLDTNGQISQEFISPSIDEVNMEMNFESLKKSPPDRRR